MAGVGGIPIQYGHQCIGQKRYWVIITMAHMGILRMVVILDMVLILLMGTEVIQVMPTMHTLAIALMQTRVNGMVLVEDGSLISNKALY